MSQPRTALETTVDRRRSGSIRSRYELVLHATRCGTRARVVGNVGRGDATRRPTGVPSRRSAPSVGRRRREERIGSRDASRPVRVIDCIYAARSSHRGSSNERLGR